MTNINTDKKIKINDEPKAIGKTASDIILSVLSAAIIIVSVAKIVF